MRLCHEVHFGSIKELVARRLIPVGGWPVAGVSLTAAIGTLSFYYWRNEYLQ